MNETPSLTPPGLRLRETHTLSTSYTHTHTLRNSAEREQQAETSLSLPCLSRNEQCEVSDSLTQLQTCRVFSVKTGFKIRPIKQTAQHADVRRENEII